LGKGSSVWIREVMMMQDMFSISNILLLEGYNHKILFFCGYYHYIFLYKPSIIVLFIV